MAQGRTRSRNADILLFGGLLGLVAPGAALAQQLGETFALEERQAAVARVPDGQIVRLRLADGGRAGGPILRWTAYSLTLGPYMGYAERDTLLALSAIDSLWLRSSQTRRGALYGAVTGGALGVALGATAGSLCPTSTGGRKEPCAQGALTSTVVGLVVGGAVGSVLGSGTPGWQRLHPRHARWRPGVRSGAEITLTAPGGGDAIEPDPRAVALARIGPGRLVRLSFGDRPDLAGYIVHAGARRATLAAVVWSPTDQPVTSMSLAPLEAIWERGTAERTGSVVATVLGFAAGVYVATTSESCEPSNQCTATIIGDGLLGGIAGWVVGGKIGSRFPRWQRRY